MYLDSVNIIQKRLARLNVPFDPEPWKHIRSEKEVDLFSYFVPPLSLGDITKDHQDSTIYVLYSGGGKTALCQWLIYQALWQPSLTVLPVPIKLSEIAKQGGNSLLNLLLFNFQLSAILFVAHHFSFAHPVFSSLLDLFSVGETRHLCSSLSRENRSGTRKRLESVFGASVVRYVQAEKVNKMMYFLSRLSRVPRSINFWEAVKNVMDILRCNLIFVFDDDINQYNPRVAKTLAKLDSFTRGRISTISFWSPGFYRSWERVACSLGVGDTKTIYIVWDKKLLRSVINERLLVATYGSCPSLNALFPSKKPESIEESVLKHCNTPRECIWATIKAIASETGAKINIGGHRIPMMFA